MKRLLVVVVIASLVFSSVGVYANTDEAITVDSKEYKLDDEGVGIKEIHQEDLHTDNCNKDVDLYNKRFSEDKLKEYELKGCEVSSDGYVVKDLSEKTPRAKKKNSRVYSNRRVSKNLDSGINSTVGVQVTDIEEWRIPVSFCINMGYFNQWIENRVDRYITKYGAEYLIWKLTGKRAKIDESMVKMETLIEEIVRCSKDSKLLSKEDKDVLKHAEKAYQENHDEVFKALATWGEAAEFIYWFKFAPAM